MIGVTSEPDSDLPIVPRRDHIVGPDNATVTLVEYGSYACPKCRAAEVVIEVLLAEFGDRMRYVFRRRCHLNRLAVGWVSGWA